MNERRDALGRRRSPTQHRGLRPLYPPLPAGMRSRSIRVAMDVRSWEVFEEAVASSDAGTRPRAAGELLERGLRERSHPTVVDWQEWQIRKERLLLARTEDAAAS